MSSVILFFVLFLIGVPLAEQFCYSCSGVCHSEPCNCQMGSCPSNQCFIEKKPTDEPGVFKITKGCLRRSPRTFAGCEFDSFSDHILCVCNGSFCNDHIYLRPYARRNVTCRKCTDRDPDCGETCSGQWCHEDTTSGAGSCGYGPPSLPFFHKGPELIPYRNKLCITLSRSAAKPHRHCICASNMCNSFTKPTNFGVQMRDGVLRSRSLGSDPALPFRQCVNCEINSHDTAVTASCKSNKCTGHFCTYVAQRHYSTGANRGTSFHSMSEKQGCVNVTDASMVLLAYEESSFIDSSCLGKSREFTVVITTNKKRPALTIQRRVEGWSGCSLFGWKGVCGKDECVIENQKEILVGRILQSQSCCSLTYLVHDMFGEVVFRIEGPGCCEDAEFKIFTVSDNAQIGTITQNDTTFMVNFPLNLDMNLKAALLGATFLIGFSVSDKKL